ncbi:VF530 family protein [Echinimonas agarilytica]|uniref:VF530 family protein n=1 Tax=Echinimonas agarilytica TaxID=1215918 RepID=UPI002557DC6A|nr:VF530 family protein [Echinimonas agarilytica]
MSPSDNRSQNNGASADPMHGVTLKDVVTKLVEHYGFERLGERIKINCFTKDPSIASSLKFLRKTPWAREKVEQLYLDLVLGRKPKGSSARRSAKSPAKNKPPHSGESIWANRTHKPEAD